MPLMIRKLLELFQLSIIWICGNYVHNTKFHWYTLYFDFDLLSRSSEMTVTCTFQLWPTHKFWLLKLLAKTGFYIAVCGMAAK